MKIKCMQKFAPVALLAAAAAGAALVGGTGCKSMDTTENAAKPQSPATGPTMQGTAPITPSTAPAVAAPALKDADYTHMLSMDAPAFESMPMGDAKPAMTAKSGTKVLVMTPGMKYSKVMASSGKSMYVPTSALKAIGK